MPSFAEKLRHLRKQSLSRCSDNARQVEKEFQGNVTQLTTSICTRKSRRWRKVVISKCIMQYNILTTDIKRKLEQLVKRMNFLIKVGLKDCNVHKTYSYRLIVQQNREDRQVVTLARGHARVRFTFYAHAATCVPGSL